MTGLIDYLVIVGASASGRSIVVCACSTARLFDEGRRFLRPEAAGPFGGFRGQHGTG